MNRNALIISLGLLIAISGLWIYYTYTQSLTPDGGYGDLTVEQAKSLIDSNPALVILDVRSQEEYDSGHLEGAILIPVDELGTRLDELSPDEDLLVYCRTGNRSSNAVNILQANGFTKIYHMKDGITAWIQAGYPTV